ncbi:MAG: sialate O-acetylesterase [Planctomycetota bacterium]
MRPSVLLFFLALAAADPAPSAQVQVPAIFADRMVLQRDAPIPVWGTAGTGESVTVTFRSQSVTTPAVGGQWRVDLAAAPASGPHVLTIEGASNTITVTDVMVGEVWICAGQSNMRQRLDLYATGRAALPTASRLNLRLLQLDDSTLEWEYSSATTASGFSAIGFFFGRELAQQRFGGAVTVGMVQATDPGSLVEAWLPGGPLYEAQLRPILPFGVRGVIWYQGEADANVGPGQPTRAQDYTSRFRRVIREWRAGLDQAALPFLYCQLPSYTRASGLWPVIREAQFDALNEPNTRMVGQVDVLATYIHPPNKLLMGQRLAVAADEIAYGQGTVGMGPIYDPSRSGPVGGEFVLAFSSTGSGLTAPGGPVDGFEIADGSMIFRPANARIEGDTVVVSEPTIANPAAVRYAWGNTPEFSLFNAEGLPAAPFRTAAQYEPFGTPCDGGLGGKLEVVLLPRASRNYEQRLSSWQPSQPGALLLGSSDQTWSALPLPLELSVLRLPGCNLYVSIDASVGFATSPTGDADITLPLPDTAAIHGIELFGQAALLCPGLTTPGLCLSNAGRAVVGPR